MRLIEWNIYFCKTYCIKGLHELQFFRPRNTMKSPSGGQARRNLTWKSTVPLIASLHQLNNSSKALQRTPKVWIIEGATFSIPEATVVMLTHLSFSYRHKNASCCPPQCRTDILNLSLSHTHRSSTRKLLMRQRKQITNWTSSGFLIKTGHVILEPWYYYE